MRKENIVCHRLHNQGIAQSVFEQPSKVVAWFGAMQAQDRASVKWAISLRCNGVAEATVEQAVIDRSIIRTWLLRGTLHITTTADVRWMLDLLAPRLIAQSARRRQQLELDDDVLALSFEILGSALREHKQLTRAEILLTLEQAGISTKGQRGYHILRHAGLERLICFGAKRGKEETFVLLDEWAPSSKRLQGDEALAELAQRYFNSHGPATLQDFAWWSGLPMAKVRTGLEISKSQLQREIIDEETYWLPQGASSAADKTATAHLLPAYDEYYLGYKVRDAVIDASYDKKAVSNSGVFRPMVVVDGQIVGIWKRVFKDGTVAITLSPFRSFTDIENEALLTAVKQYGKFVGLTAVLVL